MENRAMARPHHVSGELSSACTGHSRPPIANRRPARSRGRERVIAPMVGGGTDISTGDQRRRRLDINKLITLSSMMPMIKMNKPRDGLRDHLINGRKINSYIFAERHEQVVRCTEYRRWASDSYHPQRHKGARSGRTSSAHSVARTGRRAFTARIATLSFAIYLRHSNTALDNGGQRPARPMPSTSSCNASNGRTEPGTACQHRCPSLPRAANRDGGGIADH